MMKKWVKKMFKIAFSALFDQYKNLNQGGIFIKTYMGLIRKQVAMMLVMVVLLGTIVSPTLMAHYEDYLIVEDSEVYVSSSDNSESEDNPVNNETATVPDNDDQSNSTNCINSSDTDQASSDSENEVSNIPDDSGSGSNNLESDSSGSDDYVPSIPDGDRNYGQQKLTKKSPLRCQYFRDSEGVCLCVTTST